MRTRHWLAAITSGCLALAGVGDATAQQGPLHSNGNPDEVRFGMLPSPYNSGYGPAQPGSYPGTYQPGYPPGANQWPELSPYMGPPYKSTTFEDGFWYSLMKQGNREYYFSVDALFGHTAKPSTSLIGAPDVNLLNTDAATGNIQITVTGGTSGTTGGTGQSSGATGGLTQFNQAPISGPTRSASSSGGSTGGGTGGTGGGSGSTGVINIFPTQDTGILPDNLFSDGIRGTWGWFNADDSGFVVSGFSQSKANSTFQLLDKQLDLNLDDYRNYNASLHLHAWFGLPLGGTDTDGTSFSGTINDGAVIPYDMGVIVQFASRLAGANTDWYFSPLYEREKIKIRTLAGARYIRLQEAFLFDGTDSGMGYTVSAGSSSGGGGGGTGGATGGTGGGTNIPGYLTPTTFQSNFSIPNVIRSHLESTTIADMGGPEIGFRVDLGGKKFQIWTQTKAGALANVSQRQVSGFGIGNAFNIITPNTVPVMPRDPSVTGFSNSQTTTTFTPMFEQQVNTKIPIFNLVPYLNKMEAFEKAYLTGGYTFLFLGDVYRPHNSVIWNQWPQTPQLNRHVSNYMNHMFNVGVEWNY